MEERGERGGKRERRGKEGRRRREGLLINIGLINIAVTHNITEK